METPNDGDPVARAGSEPRKAASAIETSRLTLRTYRDEDVDPLFAIRGDREERAARARR